MKDIDLTNKCGSCDHFRQIDGTAQGECLKNPYGESVVHDPKHPYWIVPRSRVKCRWYNAPPPTNADRIRAMSDEDLINILSAPCPLFKQGRDKWCGNPMLCRKCIAEWLKQPAEEET